MTLHFGTGLPASQRLKTLIAKALDLIQEWLELINYQYGYVSVSGGKDSLVVAHLVATLEPDISWVWINQGRLGEWPDCLELIEYWKQKDRLNGRFVELTPELDLLGLFHKYGLSDLMDKTANKALDQKIDKELIHIPFSKYEIAADIQGYCMGIRAQESSGRKKNLQSRGLLYQKQNLDGTKKNWVCCPVGWWRTEDIWNYIDYYRLAYPAFYDGDVSDPDNNIWDYRLTVRNGSPCDTAGINWGRIANLRKNHPRFYQQLISYFPELARFT